MDRLSAVGDPALRSALLYVRAEEHGVTADELAEHDGIHRNVARGRLERLAAAGLVEAEVRRADGAAPAPAVRQRRTAPRPRRRASSSPPITTSGLVGLLAGDRTDRALREIGADFGRGSR